MRRVRLVGRGGCRRFGRRSEVPRSRLWMSALPNWPTRATILSSALSDAPSTSVPSECDMESRISSPAFAAIVLAVACLHDLPFVRAACGMVRLEVVAMSARRIAKRSCVRGKTWERCGFRRRLTRRSSARYGQQVPWHCRCANPIYLEPPG